MQLPHPSSVTHYGSPAPFGAGRALVDPPAAIGRSRSIRAVLLVACALLPVLATFAHAASIEFEGVYDVSRTHRPGPVHVTADGGYFTVCTLLDSSWRAFFVKTDEWGNELRSGVAVTSYLVNSAVPMEDGGYCLGGNTQSSVLKVVRVDSLGATLWSRTYGGGHLRSLRRTSDGGFIGVGRVGIGSTEDLLLLRLDVDGNVVWQRTFDLTMTSFFGQDVIEGASGGYLVVTNHVSSGDSQILLMRTDAAGDSLWTRTVGSAGTSYVTRVVRGPSNTYVASGSDAGSYLVKFDDGGNTLWERRYNAGGDDQALSLYRLSSGGYRVAAWSAFSETAPHEVRVLQVTEAGDTTWSRTFGGAGDDQPRDIAPTADGGYVVSARTQSFPADEDHLYLIKGSGAASFTASPLTGSLPLMVQFTDRSIGAPSGWSWDFDGNGLTDATSQHPSFTYTDPGIYTVRLIAHYGAVRDTVVKPRLVNLCGPQTSFPGFQDVTPAALQVVRNHQGAAWADYDSDGYPDLLVTGHSGAFLYHNEAGTGFSETALAAGSLRSGVWADSDRDGDLDLFVSAASAASLFFRNDGGTLVAASLPPLTDPLGSLSRAGSSWADYDRDGDADLFVVSDNGSSSLYRNDLASGFVDVSGIGLGDPGAGIGVAWGDYDSDGDPDVAIGRDGPQDRLNRNQAGASFVDATSGPMTDPGSFRGVAWGDYDNDADLDLFVCDIGTSRLYRNDGGTFAVAPGSPGTPSDGATWGDFDNDGDLDLFLTSNPGNALLRNDGGVFVDVTVPACAAPSDFGPGVAAADYDRDGDLDVFLAQWGAPCRLLRNVGGAGRWLGVQLRGEYSDPNGLGARVRVRTGATSRIREVAAGTGHLSQNDLAVHFGLGSATVVDSVVVIWPSGEVRALTQVATNQMLEIDELGPADDTVTVVPVTVTSISNPVAEVPIVHRGANALGVVALVFEYDDAKLGFLGVQSRVPGETFTAGLVGGRISVQWFDETVGGDPIQPSEDTLFVLRLSCIGADNDSTRVTLDRAQSAIGDPSGNPLGSVLLRDRPPFGWVRMNLGASIAGRVGYFWQDRDVPGATLSLGGGVPNQLSATDGTFAFAGLTSGSYTLNIGKSTDLDGINALDAIKVVRHGSGVEPLGNANKELAANVTGDALINAFDAIKIVRAAVGIEPLSSGNWKFLPASRSYAPLNSNLTGQGFTAIRMGDANGDWTPSAPVPPAPGTERLPVVTMAPSLSLPTMNAASSAPQVDVPLAVTDFTGIGAVSLRITYDPAVLAYVSTVSQVPGVTFTANALAGEIRIEWFDGTGGGAPINIGNGTLLLLRMDPIGGLGEISPLHFRSAVLGDASGNPIAGVGATDGQVTLVSSVDVAFPGDAPAGLARPYPNPARAGVTLEYAIVEAGTVELAVYDVTGKRVRTLVSERQDAGPRRVSWDGRAADGRSVPPGLYFIRLHANDRVHARRVLLLDPGR